jgi:isopentenyl diphosphate isomerase/L-lactate dehydrogenase-like FMN-dependent dehydrogenase
MSKPRDNLKRRHKSAKCRKKCPKKNNNAINRLCPLESVTKHLSYVKNFRNIALRKERRAAQRCYPQLRRGISDKQFLNSVNTADPYTRRAREAVRIIMNNYDRVPGQKSNKVTGYNFPCGPISWDPERLRDQAVQKAGVYISPFFDEFQAADGRKATSLGNMLALQRARLLPKTLVSFSPSGGLLPFSAVMRDDFDLSRTLTLHSSELGKTILFSPTPIFVSPFGFQRWYLTDEFYTARGATDSNVPICLSANASRSMEQIARVIDTNVYYFTAQKSCPQRNCHKKGKCSKHSSEQQSPTGPPPFRMMQFYMSADPDINASMISRAKAAGYAVVVGTVDSGSREQFDRLQDTGSAPGIHSGPYNVFQDPVFNFKLFTNKKVVATCDAKVLSFTALKTSKSVKCLQKRVNLTLATDFWENVVSAGEGFFNSLLDPTSKLYPFSVQHIASLCHSSQAISEAWPDVVGVRLPFVVKGITDLDSALAAQTSGADGILISNHAGRMYDQSISTLEALRNIRPAVKVRDPDFGIWFDSGIRRGSDVLVAYAAGAEFVGTCHLPLYGGIVKKRAGVRQALQQLVFTTRKLAQVVGLIDLNHPDITAQTVQFPP